MASERFLPGILSKFWTWFKISSKPAAASGKIVFRGEDLNGNNYFETVDKFGQLIRFVEPKDIDIPSIPMIPEINVSPEWVRWLRKTRDDPPTEEEMVRNAAIAYLKKQRAAELESEERKNWPELDAKLKQLEAERDYHPISLFPLYRDLMVTPGQEYMYNRGFYIPNLDESQSIQLESEQAKRIPSSATANSDSINQETSKEEPIKSVSTEFDRPKPNGESKLTK